MGKNRIIFCLAILLLALQLPVQAQTGSKDNEILSKENFRLFYFIGRDKYRMTVKISNEAIAVLQKQRIVLTANSRLVWAEKGEDNKTLYVDLTGRHYRKRLSQQELNVRVVITATGQNEVEVNTESGDGIKTQYRIVKGKPDGVPFMSN